MYHIPIMLSETAEYLVNNPLGLYVDCTFGGGGHSTYLLGKFKNIKIIAFDWDEAAFERFTERSCDFNGRVIFIRDNFKNIEPALKNIGVNKVDGILADIGVSSKQFDELGRGFSFNSNNLDMRMDLRNPLTAKEVINKYGQQELADIFYKYGEEHLSRQIAKAVTERRKRGVINTAVELQDIVRSVKKPEGKINPATKVFQSLRIFINRELENLEGLLASAPGLLNDKGRIVIISFHSLEDRIVKRDFRQKASGGIYKVLTKKVVTASEEEMRVNPRSRSAKIRTAERIYV
jgi:16S rRNA (cytosine1402-N4)-methyltransferase